MSKNNFVNPVNVLSNSERKDFFKWMKTRTIKDKAYLPLFERIEDEYLQSCQRGSETINQVRSLSCK